MPRIAIIGGGVAGLVAAYELVKAGAKVILFERDTELGGLASSVAIGSGQRIERYYHFICRPDRPYFEMLAELGLGERVRWVTTEMGLFFKGRMHTIGDPLKLLAFPYLSPGDKLRFFAAAAMGAVCPADAWQKLENTPAPEWLVRTYGQRVYDILYEPLLRLKFHENINEVSAAWMWGRFRRVAKSRTALGKDYLGYIEGGTDAYVSALSGFLRERGAELRTGAAIERIVIEGGRVRGVVCGSETVAVDCALSTAPIPAFLEMVADQTGPYFENLRRLKYLGVSVMLLQLNRQFSPYFWLNISDPGIDLAGIIEYTNLNPSAAPAGSAVLYLPQYMSSGHPLRTVKDEDLLDIYCGYLRRLNPAFDRSWVTGYRVHRDPYAQPICGLDFVSRIPSMKTPVEGLYLTDSYQLHPGDRTICDSTRLGKDAARMSRGGGP